MLLTRAVALLACICMGVSLSGCRDLLWPPIQIGDSPHETLSPPDKPLVPTSYEQARIEDARLFADKGDYESALIAFREIIAENPYLPEAHLGIGDIQVAQGKFAEAEPAFARAAELDPESFRAHYGQARSLDAMGRTIDALRSFHRALTLNPESSDAYLSMATAYLVLGQPEAAVSFAERAVSLAPKNGAARVNLGAAYERTGRCGDAALQYEMAMELIPPTPHLYINLIRAYSAEKRHQEATNAALQLTKVSRTSNSFERLGWAMFRSGDFAGSLEAYREAVRIDSTYWPAWNGIGVNAMNRWLVSNKQDSSAANEAREAFRRSMQINPDQPKVLRLMTSYSL